MHGGTAAGNQLSSWASVYAAYVGPDGRRARPGSPRQAGGDCGWQTPKQGTVDLSGIQLETDGAAMAAAAALTSHRAFSRSRRARAGVRGTTPQMHRVKELMFWYVK